MDSRKNKGLQCRDDLLLNQLTVTSEMPMCGLGQSRVAARNHQLGQG
jgi:hypothetical protein